MCRIERPPALSTAHPAFRLPVRTLSSPSTPARLSARRSTRFRRPIHRRHDGWVGGRAGERRGMRDLQRPRVLVYVTDEQNAVPRYRARREGLSVSPDPVEPDGSRSRPTDPAVGRASARAPPTGRRWQRLTRTGHLSQRFLTASLMKVNGDRRSLSIDGGLTRPDSRSRLPGSAVVGNGERAQSAGQPGRRSIGRVGRSAPYVGPSWGLSVRHSPSGFDRARDLSAGLIYVSTGARPPRRQ